MVPPGFSRCQCKKNTRRLCAALMYSIDWVPGPERNSRDSKHLHVHAVSPASSPEDSHERLSHSFSVPIHRLRSFLNTATGTPLNNRVTVRGLTDVPGLALKSRSCRSLASSVIGCPRWRPVCLCGAEKVVYGWDLCSGLCIHSSNTWLLGITSLSRSFFPQTRAPADKSRNALCDPGSARCGGGVMGKEGTESLTSISQPLCATCSSKRSSTY